MGELVREKSRLKTFFILIEYQSNRKTMENPSPVNET